MMRSETGQTFLACARQSDQHASAVVGGAEANQKTAFHQPVDQLDRAVMAELQPLGEGADSRRSAARQAFQSEQQLMLLRLDAGALRGRVAEAQKAPDLIAKLGQSAEVGLARFHKYIVQRYYRLAIY